MGVPGVDEGGEAEEGGARAPRPASQGEPHGATRAGSTRPLDQRFKGEGQSPE
jgi:hypothetical protein